jgi:hypothetical protein
VCPDGGLLRLIDKYVMSDVIMAFWLVALLGSCLAALLADDPQIKLRQQWLLDHGLEA